MLSKLFLPLTIAAFLSNAGAVKTSPAVSTQLCAIVAPAQSPGIATVEGKSAQPNRWQLQVRPSDLRAEASRPETAPVMVAALGAEAAPGAGDTRSSCYPALTFDTSSIPNGTAGIAYSTSLTANGGQPPYRWSFGRSQLPPGFSIDSNGDLTGTPKSAGKYNFNVVVSDSLRNNVTEALTLTVNADAAGVPVISSFSASPSVITAGSSSVLSWTVSSDATTVTLNGVAGSPVSGVSVSPSATTTYILTASNSSGTTSKTVTVKVNAAAAPVISSFSASPSVIAAGSSTMLSWSVSNATTVSLSGVGDPSASEVSVSPSATTTYILTATNSSGTTSKTVTVKVNAAAAPVISSFSASPSVITAGSSTMLSWTVSNATTVTLSGVGDPSVPEVSVSPSATTTYILTATNSSGTTSKTVTVTVNAAAAAPPVISSFSASPSVITAGSSSVLTWTVSNATTVSLSGVGDSPASGVSVSPSATTTYTLTATNSSGTASKTVTVTVNAAAAAPPVISSFSASPSTITTGSSSDLSWSVSNATTVSLSGVAGSPASGVSVSPSATTTYTLTATNSSGTASKTVTVTVNSAGAATGTALTACGDITKSGTYYLANDVSSAGNCFAIDAANVTLNLNSHTITYDTGGAINSPAIEAQDCWSTNPPISGPCGTAHGGAEVYGGTIVQAVSASTFSPVFEFGGSNAISPAPYVHDITATFQNTGAQFFYSRYLPPGTKIENNVINDNVTDIDQPGQTDLLARSVFQGQAIAIHGNQDAAGTGDTISGNKIVGSPQGGIYSDDQYTVISGNDISMNATYSNDFCAAMPADHQIAENNNCHPVSGRGFHANANYVTIENNTISVIELPQNAEYSGCELGGAYGVQVEYDSLAGSTNVPVGISVTGNNITAKAGACNAAALRVTSLTSAGSASFTGNTVTTTNTGGAGIDADISVDANNGSGVTFTGNTFSAMTAYGYGDWPGYANTTVGHNTWVGTPTMVFDAQDGGCAPGVTTAGATCPSSVVFTDSLPNKMTCGNYSEATVTIGGQVTQCKPAQ